jgi:hypothetical protein
MPSVAIEMEGLEQKDYVQQATGKDGMTSIERGGSHFACAVVLWFI